MSLCPICTSRQPGDNLCPEHPQASAFRDRMNFNMKPKTIICPRCAQPQPPGITCVNCNKKDQQINQTDDTCDWKPNHTWTGEPATTTYILGCICDKCATLTTVNLCTICAQNWTSIAPRSRCGSCNGTLSWKLQDTRTETSLEHINPSNLP